MSKDCRLELEFCLHWHGSQHGHPSCQGRQSSLRSLPGLSLSPTLPAPEGLSSSIPSGNSALGGFEPFLELQDITQVGWSSFPSPPSRDLSQDWDGGAPPPPQGLNIPLLQALAGTGTFQSPGAPKEPLGAAGGFGRAAQSIRGGLEGAAPARPGGINPVMRFSCWLPKCCCCCCSLIPDRYLGKFSHQLVGTAVGAAAGAGALLGTKSTKARAAGRSHGPSWGPR